ncbi:MAG: Zn-dependent protease [Planctomycetota bacterium]|nr:MAG: Zn-dependent protease [Planctomycetota bacterium]
MFKTYPIGRPFGVELRVHSTLLWLVGFFALSSLLSEGLFGAVSVLLWVGLLGVSVTLHELGHVLAARLFGIGTTGITLYPFGGIARLTREARTSGEEVVVALAGPAVNVFLAGLAAVPLFLVGPLPGLVPFLGVNVALAVFNLVPAYPMDGGRALRGILWHWMGRVAATRAAARMGQVFAVVFGILGLLSNFMLVVIAVFVYLQASAELRRLEWEAHYGPPPPPGVVRPTALPPRSSPFAAPGGGRRVVLRDGDGREVHITVMDPWEVLRRYRHGEGTAR